MERLEISRSALKEVPASGVPTQEKTAEAPVPVEAAGANMTPHIDGGRANEVEPRLEGAPDGAALIPGSLRGPGFSPPGGCASDLGVGELGLPGYHRVPLLLTS
jgi:hypothetical protein